MIWWYWVAAGAALLGAELTFINVEFYFVFLGGAAILVGLTKALLPGLTGWMQWSLFALLSIGSMVAFRARIYALVQGDPAGVDAGPAAGAEVALPVSLAPGQSCQAEHGGSFWTIRNEGPVTLAAGTRVRIAGVQGLTLVVRPEAA